MALCRQSDWIEVRRVDNRGRGGRGVFALRAIPATTIIETAPVLLIPRDQVFGDNDLARRNSRVSWYVFGWEGVTRRNYVALALGYGSIYNHSVDANASYEPIAPDLIQFTAIRDIAAGEEIVINYNHPDFPGNAVEFDVH